MGGSYHGVVEIPAILIAGQAGLLLGRALIGWNSNENIHNVSGQSRDH